MKKARLPCSQKTTPLSITKRIASTAKFSHQRLLLCLCWWYQLIAPISHAYNPIFIMIEVSQKSKNCTVCRQAVKRSSGLVAYPKYHPKSAFTLTTIDTKRRSNLLFSPFCYVHALTYVTNNNHYRVFRRRRLSSLCFFVARWVCVWQL